MLSTPSPSRSMQRNQYSILDTEKQDWAEVSVKVLERTGRSVWTCAGIPGVGLLVFLRDEEPDKVGVTEPTLLIRTSVPEGTNRQTNIKTGAGDEAAIFFTSVLCSSYLVTAPENNLSIILCEIAGKYTAKRLLPGEEKCLCSLRQRLSQLLYNFLHNTCNPFSQTVNPGRGKAAPLFHLDNTINPPVIILTI